MKKLIFMSFLLLYSGLSFAKDTINLVLLPDPYNCHQIGVDAAITENSTLGLIGRSGCKSDRPTYGSPNNDVRNTFSRILIPWRYSLNGAFKDGFFFQSLAGLEKSNFKSDLGSSAKVTFYNIAAQVGYQWFWDIGFNVSVLAGPTFLIEKESSKNVAQNEQEDVVKFLDNNTKSNIHGGAGVIVGWNF